jgi:hypothetical protein
MKLTIKGRTARFEVFTALEIQKMLPPIFRVKWGQHCRPKLWYPTKSEQDVIAQMTTRRAALLTA